MKDNYFAILCWFLNHWAETLNMPSQRGVQWPDGRGESGAHESLLSVGRQGPGWLGPKRADL